MASITSGCLTWIPTLWNKLAASSAVLGLRLGEILGWQYRHIPDEVLLQILSKLPAKSVLRCRSVCKRWKALTSTQEFAHLHLPHSVPMVIVARQWDGDGALYLVESSSGSTQETAVASSGLCRISVNSVRPVTKSDRQEFKYSSNGFIIFREEFRNSTSGLEHYVLLNPITRQKVRLITPKGLIYGIFSNPSAKDLYCLLWGGRFLRENGSMQYRILVLGGGGSNSNPQNSDQPETSSCCWRDVYEDDDAPFSYQPRGQTPPVIIDDVLYWMVGNRYPIARQSSSSPFQGTRSAPCCAESIMKLDTKMDKFSVMPHPGPQDEYCKDDREHSRMHLVEMEHHGFLCLCENSLFEESINIWILRNQESGKSSPASRPFWIRWCRIGIDLDVDRFPFTSSSRSNHNVRPVVIVGSELLVEWPNRGLFGLNFGNGSFRLFDRRVEYKSSVSMYAHRPSFLRLRNCEPEILISA